MRTNFLKGKLLLLSVLLMSSGGYTAGQTVTIDCNTTNLSTGSVNSSGVKNSGNMINVTTTGNRGWAVFDLSSLPAGSASINSVQVKFTTYSTTSSTVANTISGYSWTTSNDPATMSGTTLYSMLNGTAFVSGAWPANTAASLAMNATGNSFIQNNLGGKVVISYVRGSTNVYNIYGYGAGAGLTPQLVINYTPILPCSGTPAPGNTISNVSFVNCPGTVANLSLQNTTPGYGVTYQWQSSTNNTSWSNIAGATSSTYAATVLATTYYRCNLSCAGSGTNGTSNSLVVPVLGNPAPGNTLTSNSLPCPTASFTLSLQNVFPAGTVTYQWQISPAGGGSFTNITGATNASYATSQSTAMDYRCRVTCNSGGALGYSAPVSVGLAAFINCYCSSSANSLSYLDITNVTTGGMTNSSLCNSAAPGPNSVAGRYSNFTTISGPTLMQGYTHPLTIQVGGCTASPPINACAVYIDFDQNGVFGSAELVYSPPGSVSGAHTESGNIAIPLAAPVGQTRMRVINMNTSTPSAISACGTFSYGETEDYNVNIIPAVPCSGVPAAGTAYGPATVCAFLPFNLTDTGYTINVNGITKQWQSSPHGQNSWSNIAGATNAVCSVSAGISSNTDFRMVVGCSYTGGSIASNVHTIFVNPPYTCYCGPATGVTLNNFAANYLTNVAIQWTSLNNSTISPNGYELFYPTTPTTTTSLVQGMQYTLKTTHALSGYYSAAWIDYDGNGVYSSTEFVSIATSGVNGSGTFFVPWTAAPGLTGMRVRHYHQPYSAGQACTGSLGYETEDYVITIAAAQPCTGTPAGGTAYSVSSICPNTNFTVVDTGYTMGALGITFQWESSASGQNNWTAISGATNTSYVVSGGITANTDYRMVVTCASTGNTANSSVCTVVAKPFFSCYCGPNTGLTLNNQPGNYLTNVSIYGTTLNNTSTTAPNGYSLFYPTGATNTTVLTQGTYYSLKTTHSLTNLLASAWLDYNQDGVFSASEHILLTTSGANASKTFFLPWNATPGQTGLRVRVFNQVYNPTYACASNFGYETEDYVVTIAAALPCSGAPAAGTASGPSSICPFIGFTVSDTGYTQGALGISFQWESSPAGMNNWAPIAGATNTSYVVANGISASRDYHMVVSCSYNAASVASNTVSVSMSPFYNCYCSSGAIATADEEIYSVTINGTNSAVSCGTAASGPGSIAYRYSNFTAGNPIATVAQGSSVSFTIQENECDGPAYYEFGTAIWVDYNQDGIFDNNTEKVFGESAPALGPRNITGSFTVPGNAIPGNTRMRITVAEDYAGANLTSCLSYGYGETEDYILTISQGIPCVSSLSGGNAFAPANVCASTNFVVSDTAYTSAAGVSLQWQSSPAGAGIWSDIPGATNSSSVITGGITAARDFRMKISCATNSATAYSNAFSVGVYNGVVPVIVSNGPLTICSSGSVTLTAQGGSSFSWSTGSAFPSIVVSQAGTYTVTVTNSFGCTKSVSKTVIVKNLPKKVKTLVTGPTTVCQPNTIPVSINLPAATVSGFAIQWYRDNIAIPGATDMTHQASVSGYYSVYIYGGGTSCSRDAYTPYLTVKPLPTAGFTAVGNTSFCAGGSVELDAITGTGYVYKWYCDTTKVGSGATHMANKNGNYTVVTKLSGCEDTSSPLHITVYSAPPASLSTNDPLVFCGNGSSLLEASPTGPGYSYLWKKGSNFLTGATTSTYQAAVTGSYKVQVTDNNGCSGLSSALYVKLYNVPNAYITPLGPTAISPGDSVILRASKGGGFSWQWLLNSNPIVGATSRDYTAMAAGDYSVYITKGSCDSTSLPVSVTLITPKTNPVTSTQTADGFQLFAYPNPVSRDLTVGIAGANDPDGRVQIFDVHGKLVAQKDISSGTVNFDMQAQSAGIYLIRYEGGTRTESIRIMKE